MSWVKLDDRFFDNPKVAALSDGAQLAYLKAVTYCARELTDGYVPVKKAREYATARMIKELAPGLWEPTEGGFVVHDYLDYNPTRAQVQAEREAAKRRMQGRSSGRSSGETSGGNSEAPVNPTPHPYPDPDPVKPGGATPAKTAARPPRHRVRPLAESDIAEFRDANPAIDVDRQARRYLTNEQAKPPGKRHGDQVAGFKNWLDSEISDAKSHPPTRLAARPNGARQTAAEYNAASAARFANG